ncbi:MAG: acyl-CoA/acyl-ACP dehydrogenase [Actinomycetota bacterium]|nr:acyl-CoA/acyl-ACP dehydrogenase [Actinomycetota bacterium]
MRPELGYAPPLRDLVPIAARVGDEVAAPAAADVDRKARFPFETFDALRRERMLSLLIPEDLGGSGSRLTEVARAVETLARYCGSSGLIYAMHHIQIASLVRHGKTKWAKNYLRTIAEQELLLASATTEVGTGGDVRASLCAIETVDERFTLRKQAPVISYGRQSDCVLATARRMPDSPASDQVLVALPASSFELEQTSEWNTLGFRGTCSDGFILTAEGHTEQILSDPFADISAKTMLPTTHVLWASVWLGIASRAVATARTYLRAEARKNPGTMPPASIRVAELVGSLEQLASLVHGAARDYEEALDDDEVLTSMRFAIRMNALKTSASTLLVDIVGRALTICGMAAYSEVSPYSLGVALRDSYGAALMIHNDRIYANTAQMLLVHKDG